MGVPLRQWRHWRVMTSSLQLSAASDWRVMEGSWRVAACVLGCACRRFSGEWDFHSIHDHADSGIVVAQNKNVHEGPCGWRPLGALFAFAGGQHFEPAWWRVQAW